jgi:hypothetical protein
MIRKHVIMFATLVALCSCKKTDESQEPAAASPDGLRPALPAANAPDAAIIEAVLGPPMTIPIEPAAELAAAAEEHGRAVEALAEVEAASAKWPSVREEAGRAGGLAALCARRRSAGGLRAGTPPGLPGRLPATHQETELCGWKRNDRGEVYDGLDSGR